MLLRLGCVVSCKFAFDVNDVVTSQQSVNIDSLGDTDVERREAETV